jgi:hypothetical protein
MRLTRSQIRAQPPEIHVDSTATSEAADIPLPLSPKEERAPLGEIEANLVPEQVIEDIMPPKRGAKGGKGKKGKGGRKAKKVDDEELQQNEQQRVTEDERVAAASPASEQAVEDLKNEADAEAPVVVEDEDSAAQSSRATRATRRKLAQDEEVLDSAQISDEKPVESTAEAEIDAHLEAEEPANEEAATAEPEAARETCSVERDAMVPSSDITP